LIKQCLTGSTRRWRNKDLPSRMRAQTEQLKAQAWRLPSLRSAFTTLNHNTAPVVTAEATEVRPVDKRKITHPREFQRLNHS